MRKLMDWIGALICISIVLRVVFYLGAKAYFGVGYGGYDLVAIPIHVLVSHLR